MKTPESLAAGLLFGLGLVISGMANPAKVLNFLDITGTWDPTLAIVMAAAVATTAAGYRFVLRQSKPIFAATFQLPTATGLDGRLAAGASIFGTGWGLAGYCPGPAIASLALLNLGTALFVAAMLTGMWFARQLPDAWPRTSAVTA